MSLTASKNSLIGELFVRTADENYITARWCGTNRLNTDFLWLAVHALEKIPEGRSPGEWPLVASLQPRHRSSLCPGPGPRGATPS